MAFSVHSDYSFVPNTLANELFLTPTTSRTYQGGGKR